MYHIKKIKNDIRAEQLLKRKRLSEDIRNDYNKKIADTFLSGASYRYSDIILTYASKPYEIDTWEIAKRALADGKKVAYPLCDPEKNKMKFHFIESFDDLILGNFNIYEPKDDLPVFEPESYKTSLAVCLVPAVVYDTYGYRIGYGKGYYDRYLANFNGTKIGLIYSDFIFQKSLPHGRYDLFVDVLITENGVITVNANQKT